MNWFKRNRKSDFPTFRSERGSGKEYHYLDSAASSLTPKTVLGAVGRYYRDYRANVHRGLYRSSAKATAEYEDSRQKVADFLHAQPEEVIFTRGTTEAMNLLAYSIGPTLEPEDEVVVTIMEHHASFVPWQQMSKLFGFKLKIVPLTGDYHLDMHKASEMMNPKVKVLSLVHVSNVLGTVNPVRGFARLAHEQGATVIVDAAQSFGHRSAVPSELECDFLAFSGHKAYGPTGIGGLWGRRDLLESMDPFMYGGEMIIEVTKDDAEWNELPHKFEAGTPNIAGAIGLGAAVDYINSVGLDKIAEHEHDITQYALQRLKEVDGLTVIGPDADSERGGAVSFTVDGVHPHDMAHILGSRGVCVRGGHHCAMPLMEELNLPGTTRASFGIYNERQDVDALVEAIEHAKRKMLSRP